MPQNRMRRPEQFAFGKARDLDEELVAVGDLALQIGLGDDDVVFLQLPLDAGRLDAAQELPRLASLLLVLDEGEHVQRSWAFHGTGVWSRIVHGRLFKAD